MLVLLRYITLVLTLSALITIYLTLLIAIPFDQSTTINESPTVKTTIKEIVAFSLRKRIEIESEQVFCRRFLFDVDNKSEGNRGLWTRVPNSDFFVFDVYFDDRLEPFRYLRVLGMIKGSWNQTIYCQLKSEDGEFHVTKAVRTEIWSKEWNEGDEETFNPVLISCNLPKIPVLPITTLHLNAKPCEITRIGFKVSPAQEISASQKLTMTLCVKPLNFTKDISNRLMEWIEINKILGADKFEFFINKVTSRVMKVLNFYRFKYKEHFLVKTYKNIEEAFSSINGNYEQTVSNSTIRKIWQKRRNELIAYNNCLYRNIHSSHFVIPVDIDEIIVPKRFYTWKDALGDFFNSSPHLEQKYASFSVRNAYFLEQFSAKHVDNEDVTPFFFQYNIRSKFSADGESGKSFVSTNNTLTVFNHYALEVLKPGIRKTYFLPRELVQMNHYKRTCLVNLLPQCVKYLSSAVRIVDTIINKYKKEFTNNYRAVIKEFQDFYSKRLLHRNVLPLE